MKKEEEEEETIESWASVIVTGLSMLALMYIIVLIFAGLRK